MRLLAALRHRDFRLFFAGQAVSQLGDMVFFVALAWHALLVSGSASGVGIVAGAYLGGQVALLVVGGLLVDRLPRRRLLVGSDVAQGALALALTAITFSGGASLLALVLFALGFGAAQAVAMPALSAVVPDTVPPAQLTSANGLYQASRTLATVGGPLLGGALVGVWGPASAYAVNAASFAVSATMLLLSSIRPPAPEKPASVLHDAREGWRYVAGRAWLWMAIAIFSVFNIAEAGARHVALPVYASATLGVGAQGLGLLHAGAAVGALVGYAALGGLDYGRARGLVAYGGVMLAALAVGGLAFAPGVAAAVALSSLRGIGVAAFMLTWETALQQNVARGMRGRVVSIDMLGSFALLPIAMPAYGALVDVFGPRASFAGAGLVMVVCASVGLASRRARSLGDAPLEKGDAERPESAAP